jgi:hypothetical protein
MFFPCYLPNRFPLPHTPTKMIISDNLIYPKKNVLARPRQLK